MTQKLAIIFLALVQIFYFLARPVSGGAALDAILRELLMTAQMVTSNQTTNSHLFVRSVIVSFENSLDDVFAQFEKDSQNFTDLPEKRRILYERQLRHMQTSQATLQQLLIQKGITSFKQFWISNQLYIPNATPALINALVEVPGVASLHAEHVAQLHGYPRNESAGRPFFIPDYDDSGESGNDGKGHSKGGIELRLEYFRKMAEWGIRRVRADEVWEKYTGDGVVVANIDTGVRHTHEVLKKNWRSSYGWFDALREMPEPYDDNGHGTHTMGTIAGHNGIGVAPGAKWISCKGCNNKSSCAEHFLLSCAEWIQCPTNELGKDRDCSRAPDIVSNSWGDRDGGGLTWYDNAIRSWRAAGIIPVFSVGNMGPDCGSVKSPGDRPGVIGVGNVAANGDIAKDSGRGPSADGRVLPHLVAPGSEILSASHVADDKYINYWGTSMACPHVAGIIALMRQKQKDIRFGDISEALLKTSQKHGLNLKGMQGCGGTDSSSWPNNVFGHGLVDAWHAILAI